MNKQEFIEFMKKERGVSESSSQTHFYNVRRIQKFGGINSTVIKPSHKVVKNKAIPEIEKLLLIPQRNLVTSAVTFLKIVETPKPKLKKWMNFMTRLAGEVDKTKMDQTRSDKQRKNWVELNEILELYQKLTKDIKVRNLYSVEMLTKNDRSILNDQMFLALYGVLEPPGRLEWGKMKLVSRSAAKDYKNENILYREKRTFTVVIQNHKTKRKTGVIVKTLSPKAALLIKKYIKRFEVENGDNLLKRDTGADFDTKEQFGRRIRAIFKRYFGKNIGASLLRSIFLTNYYEKMPALQKMAKLSNQMGHSIQTALSQYVKKN